MKVVFLFLLFIPSYSLVITDACFSTTGCDIDPATGKRAPLTIQYRTQTTIDQDWVIDQPLLEKWSQDNNITVVIKRPAHESIRYSLPPVLSSSIGPDVLIWQSIVPFVDNCYDLTNTSGNWSRRYPKRLLDLVKDDRGRILAMPDRYSFWGIWYRKDLFLRLDLSIPTTWIEFIEICRVIRKEIDTNSSTGLKGVIGISHGDLWQGMTWWEIIAVRLGGASWWNKFIKGEIDTLNDPIHRLSWNMVKELIDLRYFPSRGDTAAATGTYLTTLVSWAKGESAMTLASGTARTLPGKHGLNNSDYDFFPFPSLNASLPVGEEAEFSTVGVWAVNKDAKQLKGAISYMEMLASDEYQRAFVNNLNGAAPTLSSIRSLITDPILQRGFSIVENVANVFSPIDAVLPSWAKIAKPIMFNFFTGSIDLEGLLSGFEGVRQEILLRRVVPPTAVVRSGMVILSTTTANSSIFYSRSLGFYPYLSPIELLPGTITTIRAYARHEFMRDSPTIEQVYVGSVVFRNGDLIPWTYSSTLVPGILLLILLSWQLLVSIDIAIRSYRWIVACGITFGVTCWSIIMIIASSITFPVDSAFDMVASFLSMIVMIPIAIIGYIFAIIEWKSLSIKVVPVRYISMVSETSPRASVTSPREDVVVPENPREYLPSHICLGKHGYIMASSLLITIGIVSSQMMMTYSMRVPGDITLPVAMPIVAFVVGWPVMYAAMAVYLPRRTLHPILRVVLFCSLKTASIVIVATLSNARTTWRWNGQQVDGEEKSTGVISGLIAASTVLIPGILFIPFALGNTIYASLLERAKQDVRLVNLQKTLHTTTTHLHKLEARRALFATFNPGGSSDQLRLTHFSNYLSNVGERKEELTVDDWLDDEFASSILLHQSTLSRDDESMSFVLIVRYYKEMPIKTIEQIDFCIRVARNIRDIYITGDSQVNISQETRTIVTSRLMRTDIRGIKDVFDDAVREVKNLITKNALTNIRVNYPSRHRMGCDFITAGKGHSRVVA